MTSTAVPTPTGAPSQAGIFEGLDPTKYQPKNPIVLFIIQAAIIILTCRVLHWPLSRLRQPRVIAEVIGGIVLGPTVMGRIPGFNETIFPQESKPVLSAIANLGLILFLFLVGLEVDMRMLLNNLKVAVSVSAAGMLVPFGLGAGIGYGLYHEFGDDQGTKNVSFGVFVLFIGVAMAITAFPVLARILTELKLLHVSVGVITLAAGVGNDVVGWVLLALTVTLVNAGEGLTALYVLLVSVGWVLFLMFAVRPVFIWILRRDGSLEKGPTQSSVALTLLMVLASAFFTDIIGVHAIFGGFLIGLICPHEGGFAVRLTEKIEDLVSVLFLPLYFALSGLNTNIGLLTSGIAWVYVIGVIAIAFIGKIAGGTLAAKLNGLVWRESFTIGVLMSCKGLVELIVLNIGLQAGIISVRVFTMFVIMALITTFATTPLVKWLFPPSYQKKLAAWKRGEIDWDGNRLVTEDPNAGEKGGSFRITKMTMFLRLDSLPGLFTFINLLGGNPDTAAPKVHKAKQRQMSDIVEEQEDGAAGSSAVTRKRPLEVHGLRIVELTQRTSTVMKVSEVDEFTDRDPVLNVFRTFGRLNNLAVSAGISVAPEDSFAEIVTSKAADRASELLLIPWSETGAVSDAQDPQSTSIENRFTNSSHNQFISSVLDMASCNTAILVNRGFGGLEKGMGLSRTASMHSLRSRKGAVLETVIPPIADPSHHVFFPFFGGEDDRLALRFVLQLASNTNVTATIVHYSYNPDASDAAADLATPAEAHTLASGRRDLPRQLSASNVPTLNSSSVTNLPRTNPTPTAAEADSRFFTTLSDTLVAALQDRVLMERCETAHVLHSALSRAQSELGTSKRNAGDLLVIGRAAKLARPHVRKELVEVLRRLEIPSGAGSEVRRALGDVAEAAVVANVKASVLVVQASGDDFDGVGGVDGQWGKGDVDVVELPDGSGKKHA